MEIMIQNARRTLELYPGTALSATEGTNRGDSLSIADDLDFGDIYELDVHARRQSMLVNGGVERDFDILTGSETGSAGHSVRIDCALTFIATSGKTIDVLVLVELTAENTIDTIYALPMTDLSPREPYTLVGIDRDISPEHMAQLACASFIGGTHVTLASGAQVPVERLRAGDMVQTRDNGAQPVLWVGQNTRRAQDDAAPVCIREGALNNHRDLMVSPDQYILLTQHAHLATAGRQCRFVKAGDLVNTDTITRQSGGHMDSFQLLFEANQVIYAEGVPMTSMQGEPDRDLGAPYLLRSETAVSNVHVHPRFAATLTPIVRAETA